MKKGCHSISPNAEYLASIQRPVYKFVNTSLLKSLAISSVDQFNPALVISYIYLYLKVKTSLSGYNLTAQVLTSDSKNVNLQAFK